MRLLAALILTLGVQLPAFASVTEELARGKIPLYPGAKPHPTRLSKGDQAIVTVEADLRSVVAFYRKELPRKGWRSAIDDDLLNRDLDKVPLALLLYEKGDARLRVVVASRPGAKPVSTIWLGAEPSRRQQELEHGKPAR